MPPSHTMAGRHTRARTGDAPTLRGRIASALLGRESLHWTFWTMTVAGGALVTAVITYVSGCFVPFVLAANRNGHTPELLQAFSSFLQGLWLAFVALCTLALWRCSKNTAKRHWTYVACAGALVWLVWTAYGAVAPFVPSAAAIGLPSLGYAKWLIIAVVASAAVTRARGGATFKSVLALVLFFVGAALAPFVASAVYLAGPAVFVSPEALIAGGGWGILIGMFYFVPALAVATLSCFIYALGDRETPRLRYASFVFLLLSAGLLTAVGLQRYFT